MEEEPTIDDPAQRAKRLAEEAAFRPGDPVQVGNKVHRTERASYLLAGRVRTFCGKTVAAAPAGGGHVLHCQVCERAWSEARSPRLGL